MHNEDTTPEVWRPVPQHDGYEISTLGRARSLDRVVVHSSGISHRLKGRDLRAQMVSGYPAYRLTRRKLIHAHRLIMLAFVPQTGPVVRHLDGDPLNCRIDNLAWGTYSDNEYDKRTHGRALVGERHHHAVLSDDDVLAIRRAYTGQYGELTALARKYGVSRTTIKRAATGANWSHL